MAFDPNQYATGQVAEPERRKKSEGFNPDEFAGTAALAEPYAERPVTGQDVAQTAGQGVASAAATAYGLSGDVITPRMAYDAVGRPVMEATGSMFQRYVADPFRAGRDIAASKIAPGIIPGQVLREAAPGIAEQTGKIVSTSPLTTSPTTGSRYPASVPDYRAVQKMAGPEIGQKMSEAYARGGNTAVLDMLDRDPAAKRLLANPEFAQAVQTYRQAVPTTGLQKLGRGLGLVGRTAGRLAGPIGLGMTAYDIYQMAPKMAEMYRTGVSGRQGQLGQTADEFGGAVPQQGYVDIDRQIREEAARKALQR